MKISLTVFFSVVLCLSALSQKGKDTEIPSFGDVPKSDLEMSECLFDKDAEALILLEDGELSFVYGAGLILEKHVRIKILKKEGLERANVHIRYDMSDGDASIKDITAQTYNLSPSGEIVVSKMDKKSIYQKKINKRIGEKVFSLPEVKVGSVIEYKYKQLGIGLINWYFQKSIPVKMSRYILDFPEDIQMRITPFCSRQFQKTTESRGTRFIQVYKMRDIPGFRNESYVINDEAYMDRLETTMSAYKESNGLWNNRNVNWMQVINKLMEDEDFGIQLKRDIPRTADLDAALGKINDPYLRMKTIHEYVRKNMTWNEYDGIWALDGVKSAWKDHKGTTGEINLILVNLLREAGLNAKPVLVSTHDYGMVNTSDAGTYDFPGYMQFNKVLAYVEIEGNTYVLDGAEKITPTHLIPPSVTLNEGLVIEKIATGEWGWKYLWDEKDIYKNLILINGNVDTDGKMKGEVNVTSYDYARLERIEPARKGKKEYQEEVIGKLQQGLEIDTVYFENLDSDSLPLVQKIKFTEALNNTGDYEFFSVNLFTGLETNPFVADKRQADVFFGYNQSYLISANIMIPEGYEFEGLPQNIRMIMPDTSISVSRISQFRNGLLSMRINLDFKKPFYTVQEYEEFQMFYKKLFDILNEQFVIRKKVKP